MVRANNYGRCGNVLFQVATCIGYALKHGIEFSVQTKSTSDFWNPLYLQHLVNPNWVEGKRDVLIREHGMPYQELPFKEEWRYKQIVLDGYWQSEKYFKEYREEILKLFGYHWLKADGVVSVHVRRGDYLELKNKHPEVTVDWYNQAMEMFPGYHFNFYSDDISWCKQTFAYRGDCSFSENKTIEQDLVSASCCEHNIISASTFGWWQAWLNRNPDKIIVLPKLWFVENWNGDDTKDIVPENWIKL